MECFALRSPIAIEGITETGIRKLRSDIAYQIISDKDFGWDESANTLRNKIIEGENL
jgi:hypothetical protein